tara:strand:- start:45631 stop:46497 length:867 start_codon:yes stop_codon:yes gene_type:complete
MKKQKKLLWNAGKFVYQRGSNDPLLFLPLEDFFRSTTEELCYLVLLRGQQESIHPEKVNNTDIFFWIKRNSVEEISSLIKQLLKKNYKINKLLEFYSGIGLLYERLKYLKKKKDIRNNLEYLAYDNEYYTSRFKSIHQEKNIDYKILKNVKTEDIKDKKTLKVFNLDYLIKRSQKVKIDYSEIFSSLEFNSVYKMRVNTSSEDQLRTTVDQRVVQLPSIKKVCHIFSKSKIKFLFKFYERFDEDYFLPDVDKSSTGQLILYSSENQLNCDGYKDFNNKNINLIQKRLK